jgi:hypothetical protein
VDKVCQKFRFHFHGCVESFLGVLTSEPSLKLDKEKNSATKKLTVATVPLLNSASIVIIPSGKHTHNYGKSPFSMGKSTINGHFQ